MITLLGNQIVKCPEVPDSLKLFFLWVNTFNYVFTQIIFNVPFHFLFSHSIHKIKTDANKGINKIVWNFRYTPVALVSLDPAEYSITWIEPDKGIWLFLVNTLLAYPNF